MKTKTSFNALIGLTSLLIEVQVNAATIDTTVVLPDEFDGVRTDYLQVGSSSATIGMGSIALGGSSTGDYSISAGIATLASGSNSIAIGNLGTIASGHSSAAFNWSSATGSSSFSANFGSARGDGSLSANSGSSYGRDSVAFGVSTFSIGQGTFVLGKYNDIDLPDGESIYTWAQSFDANVQNPLNHLFVIGNGADTNNRSNAMVVYHNGNTDLNGDVKVEGALNVDGSPVLTQASLASTGITGAGTGSLNIAAPSGVVNLSGYDVNVDAYFTANGSQATIADSGALVPNANNQSLAWGVGTVASGQQSTAFGEGTIAGEDNSLAIGKFNAPSTGSIFSVGNGSSDTARSNAFEIKADGSSLFSGDVKLGSSQHLAVSEIRDSGAADLTIDGYYGLTLKSSAKVLIDGSSGTEVKGDFMVKNNSDEKVFEVHEDGTITINKVQGDVSMGIFGE